ncbi:MAG TPA: zinc ribbon domain-containing protein [Geobacteraceae bacterium]|nr:zinc ribbon domain-containing protein [Geobacteraceae bacterium]
MRCETCGKEIAEDSSYCPYCFRRFGETGQTGGSSADRDFGIQLNLATALWKDNLGDLVIFTLVFTLVGWLPIVNAAFIAGYIRGLQSLTRGVKPKAGDIFKAWDCFGNTLAYCLILLAAVIVAGFIPFFGPVAQFAVTLFGTPGLYHVVDRDTNAIEAIKWSINSVQKHFAPWLLSVLVGGILGSIGLIVLLAGVIVTLPWGTLLIIQQYEKVKGE